MTKLPPAAAWPAAAAVAALLWGVVSTQAVCQGAEPAASASPADNQFYEQQVQPLLKQHCLRCHGEGKKIEGGLRLTSRSSVLRGGDSGPAVDLDKPMSSRLVEAINYRDLEMPPKDKLPPDKIAVLTRWVELKIPFPPGGPEDEPAPPPKKKSPQVDEQNRNFWSFRHVVRPPVPQVKGAAWVRNPIDAFILSRLEQVGLEPAPAASKQVLIRRATYDLWGLPPSPEEVAAYTADDRPDAYERLVDRLLASPHYGERWGRHWLDLVRYADTNSYERDSAKPYSWGYRDYVIRSLNEDKPYDRFVREQLAGDELPGAGNEGLIATGFYRLGIWDDEPGDAEQARYDELDDIVGTVGQVFLGLTVNCARCHDHKLDPIPQRDYYRMLAFFGGITRYGTRKGGVEEASLRPLKTDAQGHNQAEVAAYRARFAKVNDRIKQIEALAQPDFDSVEKDEFKIDLNHQRLIQKRVPRLVSQTLYDEYLQLMDTREDLRNSEPPAMQKALCVTEVGRTARDTFILLRGSPKAPLAKVEPGFLSIVEPSSPTIPPAPAGVNTTGRRSMLANWIAGAENPLTARVMANRVWQYHFGRGLVRSPNNFGLQGTAPTHSELLDYLATELVAGGWRLKSLHRTIMLSSAYRMSSAANAAGLARDHDNDLFWRFDMRRLEGEEIRDSILAINGTLNLKMGGPGVYPIIPKAVLAGQSVPGAGWHSSSPADRNRRSIYVHQKRSLPLPLVESFDAADADGTCPVRFASTQPTQALSMLNSEMMFEEAGTLAAFVETHAGPELRDRVAMALRRAMQREPVPKEIDRGVRLIEEFIARHQLTPHEALRRYCLIVYSLDEFVYLD
ncbi:MAG: PSD1 and planctomycete cytochrome C domain-containing protein [Planctomycetia bacterium]|nr:PSD1 and planctomycete cytochrome C domain-containing protein [Planctomycetia bacterium]